MTTVEWGPCYFCARDIEPSDVNPCRVQVSTAGGKWQVWMCHAACFKERINPPSGPRTDGSSALLSSEGMVLLRRRRMIVHNLPAIRKLAKH